MKETQFKQKLKQTINKANLNNILTQANNKSKLRDLISYKSPENMEKTQTYMKELTRTECTGIFAIRSRMVKTKSNYKTQHNDQKCRWCITELETQNHIITDLTKHINYKKIMENDSDDLKWEATQLNHIINRINKQNKPKPTYKTQLQVTPPKESVRPGQPGIHNTTTTT